MDIVIAASEGVPFSKTGGLADVVGALSRALAQAGHRVAVILPYYPRFFPSGLELEPLDVALSIPLAGKNVSGRVLKSRLPHGNVPVYLIDQPQYFARDQLYAIDGKDYHDNCERFVFFSRSVLQAVERLGLDADCIHANDWQTGLVPAYLAIEGRALPALERVGSVFTVHNMAFQGKFWHWDMELTGLDWKYFNWRQMEFYGHLNLLKTGMVFADVVTTVSPTYAREIQTPPLRVPPEMSGLRNAVEIPNGCGLEDVARSRSADLFGIVNAIDTDVWNPATDPYIAAHFDAHSVETGKPVCKTALQQSQRLPVRPDVPLVGMITRLTGQKGLDLFAAAARAMLAKDLQFVVLGTGEAKYHTLLEELAARHPEKLAANLTFSEPLAHQIEAGADLFLMPSLFEPCGLNQLYSLRYGTVPLVRRTGGLADTVIDATPEAVASGEATGFCFSEYSRTALLGALERALEAFRDRTAWLRLVRNGMRQDWSWQRSAAEYARLYERAAARHRQAATLAARG